MSESQATPKREALRVLNLEDSQEDSALIRAALAIEWKELELLRVETREAFVRAMEEFKPDVVLCDIQLHAFDGLSALKIVRQFYSGIPVIIVTAALGENEAVDLIKMGARDCVLKDHLRSLTFAVYGALSLERGIRERKQVEQALRENEPRYQAIMDTANDAIICSKPDGTVYLWNRKAEQMFGYTAAEAIGRNLYELISPEHNRKDALQALQQHARTGNGTAAGNTVQLTAKRKDDSEFPVELSVSTMQIGREWHTTSIIRDITERKQLEEQLRAQYEYVSGINTRLLESNKQLEQAQMQLLQSDKMAAIGLLAAGVAHEINNPIGYVSSNLGTLERYLADIFAVLDKYGEAEALLEADNPLLQELRQLKETKKLGYLRTDVKSLIAESHQGLERVKHIVLDLRDFSHSSEDRWVWADVHKGLESTLNVVWNELKYKCEVVKEFGVLPQIYCLPSQLNQVFMNLLVNAAQAIEVHGKITIRTGQEGGNVWVEVIDTGAGIPPENIPRLFDPFFTTKPVGRGTGLGLSVSFRIVEKHRGRIEVQSEEGKGSTFRVILPVQPDINRENA